MGDCTCIRSWLTFAIAVFSIMLPSIYANPLSAEINSTTELQGNQSKKDCLNNQYYSIINHVCENCTYCPPGTQHSSLQATCGSGEGVNTTCVPCKEKYYQNHGGYSQLKCSRCVTCDVNADILQDCSANGTQNAKCGPCHTGYYTFTPNVCFKCSQATDHPDCAQTTTMETSMNQSSGSSPSTTPPPSLKASDHPSSSLNTSAHPPSSLPSGDIEATTDTHQKVTGSQTTRGSRLGLGLGAFILSIIVICVGIVVVLQCRNRTGTTTSSTSTTSHSNATFKQVTTISTDQPSTSSATDAVIECASGEAMPSSGQERECLLWAGPMVTPPATLPIDVVTNECPSMPHTLSIHGGVIHNGIGMYPNLDQGQDGYRHRSLDREPGSPDSAKVNFCFQGDDCNVSSPEPMALRS